MKETASNSGYSKGKKKEHGSFFTPSFLADFLAVKIHEYIKKNKDLSVLDPATGDSALLLSIKSLLDLESNSCTYVGIDIDLAAINNSRESIPNNSFFFETDALYPFGLKDWSEVSKRTNIKLYDVICSNPPWGASLSKYSTLKVDFKLATGQFDIYDLFVETIFNQLKEGGVYGIILPDSIYSIEHIQTRNKIFNESSVKVVLKLGEGFFDGVFTSASIIIGVKESPKVDNLISCYHVNRNERIQVISGKSSLIDIFNKKSHQLLQSEAVNNKTNTLNVFVDNENKAVFNYISSMPSLGDFVEISRGVELSKKGSVIQCPYCKKWQPSPRGKKVDATCNSCSKGFIVNNQKTIVHLEPKEECSKIIVGEDIDRYGFFKSHFIETNFDGINYKSRSNYKSPKILIRKTGVGITANIDYDNSLTNQVVYLLRPKSNKDTPIETILAIINSRVITYFLINAYGLNEWQSHPYISQSIVKSLPFPSSCILNPDSKVHLQRIKRYVTQIARNGLTERLDANIEIEVAFLFGLTKDNYHFIFEGIRAAQQLIPFKRLISDKVFQYIVHGL